MLDNLYDHIGNKIKRWAKWIFICEAIASVIAGLALTTDDDYLIVSLLLIFLGPIVAWVSSWLLYAFGQLVEDVHAMRNKEGTEEDVANKEKAERTAKREEAQANQRVYEAALRKSKENPPEEGLELSDDDFIEIVCPTCKKTLYFIKDTTEGTCPECGAEILIK